MKIDNLDITELSYLDALNILKRDLKSDTSMPNGDKAKARKLVDELFVLLWKYSA